MIMSTQDQGGGGDGWARRGLVALGIATGIAVTGGLAGFTFATLEKMPGGPERNFYTYSAMAVAIAASLLVIFGGSRLFLRAKVGVAEAEEAAGGGKADAVADKEGARPRRSPGNFGAIIVMLPIFHIFIEFTERASDFFMSLLSLTQQPFTLMLAAGVTPIMAVLAVAERPEGARVKWRTVIFTAALWPAALLADLIAPTAAEYEGVVRFIVTNSMMIVMVGWIALGGALGTLDVMFSLSNPRAYEEKLKGVGPLTEGWSFWHGAAFLAIYFGLRWLDRQTGIPAFTGNPAYFAAVFAAATVALSRPRGARGWALAAFAGTVVATLMLLGAAAASMISAGGPATRMFLHMLMALPAIILALLAVRHLGPRSSTAQSGNLESREGEVS